MKGPLTEIIVKHEKVTKIEKIDTVNLIKNTVKGF